MFHPARLLGLPTFWSPPCPFIYFSIFFQIFLNFSKLFQNFPDFSEFFRIILNFSEFFLIFPEWKISWPSLALERKKDFTPCPFIMHIFSLPVYLILKKFPPCPFIRVCPFINFSENFNPARLLGTARLLGHSEYEVKWIILMLKSPWKNMCTQSKNYNYILWTNFKISFAWSTNTKRLMS